MIKVLLRSDRARRRLAAMGLTQIDVAASVGVELRTVQRWFSGQRVRLDLAERVAMLVRLGTGELFEDVPPAGLRENVSGLRTVLRLISGRDGGYSQVFRLMERHGGHALDLLLLRAHPTRGHVCRVSMDECRRHGFILLRVRASGNDAAIQIYERMTRSTLVERAWAALSIDRVWLVENLYVRSMAARPTAMGCFDLWYWPGDEVHELVFASDVELDVVISHRSEEAPNALDMTLEENEGAVCVRPTSGQLLAAGLPEGYERISSIDPARIDIPVPGEISALGCRLRSDHHRV